VTAPVRAPARSGGFLPLAGGSVALVAITAALGPSATESSVGRHGWLPPYAWSTTPPDWLVSALLVGAVALGAAALGVGLRRGLAVRTRTVLVAGAVAAGVLCMLPPIGSADPLSYAAYGHAAVSGHDPYADSPATLAARGDRFAAAVESPWQRTPSVYGPVATAEQAAVAWLARGSLPVTVWLLGVVNALAFVATGLVLQALARTTAERRRAALLWSGNPLLLLVVVAGAHLDALVVAFIAAALLTARRLPVVAGALAGAAAAVKAPAALVGIALAWASLRRPRRLAALAVGAAVVAVPAYLLAGPHVLDQLGRASRLVSFGTPWHFIAHGADHALGRAESRRLISRLAVVVAVSLAVVLLRGLPSRGDAGRAAARVACALVLAWLLAAPYALPWYDASAWVLLALLAASAFDVVLLAHTTVLALAYIPGRDVPLASPVAGLASAMRGGVSPVLLTLVLAAAVAFSLRARPVSQSAG
jgi:hypothetical protein